MDVDSRYRQLLEAELDPGERLEGLLVASQQKGVFRGGAVVIGVTPGRLIVQELDRRGDADGAPRTILPQDLAGATVGDAGGGWPTIASAIMDREAARLTLKLRDGDRLKLMLMRGEGAEALGEWFGRLG